MLTPLGAPALTPPHPFPFSRIHTKSGDNKKPNSSKSQPGARLDRVALLSVVFEKSWRNFWGEMGNRSIQTIIPQSLLSLLEWFLKNSVDDFIH